MLLRFLLPLIAKSIEVQGTARSVVLLSGEELMCSEDELHSRLAETEEGARLLADFTVDYHRFGRKTTVAHLMHLPSSTGYVGTSFSTTAERFNKKVGQDLALRDAAAQFLQNERYRQRWLAHHSPIPL